ARLGDLSDRPARERRGADLDGADDVPAAGDDRPARAQGDRVGAAAGAWARRRRRVRRRDGDEDRAGIAPLIAGGASKIRGGLRLAEGPGPLTRANCGPSWAR